MRDRDGTNQEVLAAQAAMFRAAERDHGLTLKAIASETGIPLSTLQSWVRDNIFARAKISLPDFVTLCAILPDDCTSLILEPVGKHVGSMDDGDGCIDELAAESAGLTHEILDAKRDGKVTHIERARIANRGRRVAAVSRKVAAA